MNTLNIEKVENGFIFEWLEQVEEDKWKAKKELIEVDFDLDPDKEGWIRVLKYVAEHFGVSYDRFGENNLQISFEGKGHKVD